MAITGSPTVADETAAKIAGATLGRAILGPPTFDDVADERAHRKAKLAGALRIFGRFGFGEGVAGHITVRDPERPGSLLGQPVRQELPPDTRSDLLLVNHQGEVVEGARRSTGRRS